jgi:hypothetical protein
MGSASASSASMSGCSRNSVLTYSPPPQSSTHKALPDGAHTVASALRHHNKRTRHSICRHQTLPDSCFRLRRFTKGAPAEASGVAATAPVRVQEGVRPWQGVGGCSARPSEGRRPPFEAAPAPGPDASRPPTRIFRPPGLLRLGKRVEPGQEEKGRGGGLAVKGCRRGDA